MKKEKKVCTIIAPVGQPDQYGNNAFSISFADGTNGFFKCKEQDLFTVGVESEFYMGMVPGKSGKEYSKIQRVSAVEFEGSPNVPSPSISEAGKGANNSTGDMINRSVAIKAVAQMRQGSSRTMENVIEEAEILFDYIQFGVKIEDPKTGHEKALETPATVQADELPF